MPRTSDTRVTCEGCLKTYLRSNKARHERKCGISKSRHIHCDLCDVDTLIRNFPRHEACHTHRKILHTTAKDLAREEGTDECTHKHRGVEQAANYYKDALKSRRTLVRMYRHAEKYQQFHLIPIARQIAKNRNPYYSKRHKSIVKKYEREWRYIIKLTAPLPPYCKPISTFVMSQWHKLLFNQDGTERLDPDLLYDFEDFEA